MAARIRPSVALAFAVAMILLGGLSFGILSPSQRPVLVFRGYRGAATNSTQLATFELKNSTRKAIWLCFEGEEFPLRPPFLERQSAVTTPTNGAWANVTVRFSHWFTAGKMVPPGESLFLDFPLNPARPVKQVGVEYYVGMFADDHDFVSHLGTPLLSSNASWKETAAFYLGRLKRMFKRARRYEIWCPRVLSSQKDVLSNRPSERGLTAGPRD